MKLKAVVSSFLVVSMFSLSSLAVCDFKNIIKQENGTYVYPKDCHLETGQAFAELDVRREQVNELKKALILKDSLTVKLEERTQLWMDTSLKLNDKIQTYEKYRSDNNWMIFGAGVLTTILAGWALGQAAKAGK